MTATFVVNVVLSAVHGHPADMSNPGLISFGKFTDIRYRVIEIPIFLVMGALGGLLGAGFCSINARLIIFRKKNIRTTTAKVLEAVIVAALSAVSSFVCMYVISDCAKNEVLGEHRSTR